MVATKLDLLDRRSLMASLPKGGIGAEIGVAEGSFSQVLLDVTKPKKLWLIDPWEHITTDALKDDSSNVPQDVQDARCMNVISNLDADPAIGVVRMYSLDAIKYFLDDSLDWVYIDADHTQAGADAEAWWPKVKSDGWLTGHDYTIAGVHITVKTQIDEFVAKHNLTLFVTRGDNDIYEKNYPSWAVQKP